MKPLISTHTAFPLCPNNLFRQLHYSFLGKGPSLPAETVPELQGKSLNQTDTLFNNIDKQRTDNICSGVSTTHSFLILTPASWYKTKRASKPTIGGLINYHVRVLNAKHVTILSGRGCFSCPWTGIASSSCKDIFGQCISFSNPVNINRKALEYTSNMYSFWAFLLFLYDRIISQLMTGNRKQIYLYWELYWYSY